MKRRLALGVALSVTVLSLVIAAQGPDPVIGNWQLNLAKSKFVPGPAPKSETRVYTGKGVRTMCTVRTTDADGKPFEGVSTYAADGKDYAFNDYPNGDWMQSVTQVDPYTITATIKESGKVVQNVKRVISKDGKTLTITTTGTNGKGQKIDELRVYDRR